MDPVVSPVPAPPFVAPVPRHRRWATLVGGLAAMAYVGLVDPSRSRAYPQCPSRILFGVDCPACGGLRGTHDLLHGHVLEALNHNLLLPAYLAVIGLMAGMYLLPLAGRPARALRPPRGLLVAGLAVVVAFTVARNLPVAGLRFLDAAGS